MSDRPSQVGDQISDEQVADAEQETSEDFDRDLRSDPLAGSNWGLEGAVRERDAPVAANIKEFVNAFPEFSNDDLKQIAVLLPGTRLQQGASYVDMKDPNRQEFKARADMVAGNENWHVAKSETDYQLWNRLIGVQNPERLGEADDS